MEFEFWPAVFAGIIGGMIMAMTRMIMRAAGVDLKMHVPRIWGTMMKIYGTPGRVLGMMIHLLVSAVIALIYAWAFDLIGASGNLWLWGLLGGAIHWVLAGMFVAMMPPMHPEIPERLPAPGAFAKNFGTSDILGFLMGHLLYGISVGILYAYFSGGGTAVAF